MGVFDRVKAMFIREDPEQRSTITVGSTPLSDPANWLTRLLSITGTNGTPAVSQGTALSVTPLWRALKILGESIGSLEVEVFRIDREGNKTLLRNHPVARLLRSPSNRYTPFTFFSAQTALCALHGNAYAVLKRDGNFRVREMIFVHPQSVSVDIVGNEVEYTITPYRGPTIKAYTGDVIHLANMPMSEDGICGTDLLKVHRRVLANAIGGNNYAGSFMDQGISIGGVLRHETKSVSADRRKEIGQQLKSKFSGAENAGNVLVLDEGWQFTPIEMKANDQMFANSVKMSVEDASRLTGVPVHLLSSLENATFSNIEHQSREFVTYTLLPWAQRWAEELGRKLFTSQEQDNHFIRFNMDSLLRGDTESESKLIQVLMQYGIATPNEIRAKFLDWNGREDGDKPLMPANIVGKAPAVQGEPDTDESDDENERMRQRANIVD